jgi:hypothetical protein
MSDRDELAAIIDKALGDVTGIFDTSDAENSGLADAILAAGYGKEPSEDRFVAVADWVAESYEMTNHDAEDLVVDVYRKLTEPQP